MKAEIKNWKHVTKLDPDRGISAERLEMVFHSGTDALIVGGTQGITRAKVAALLNRLSGSGLPIVIEVSSPEAAVPGADGYLIPVVLNASDVRWIVGEHQSTLKQYAELIDWSRVLCEGYIILNGKSAVAKLTGSRTDLSPRDAAAYAQCAVHILGLPIVYLEYSGIYGDPCTVRAVREALDSPGPDHPHEPVRLFYGGGIDSPEKAAEMGRLADTVVVGNLVYEDRWAELPATVRAVKEVKGR